MRRVEEAVQTHSASSVVRLNVRIGELSGVNHELFASAFTLFREGTICADTELQIKHVPARWECSKCGQGVDQGEILRCVDCAAPARLVQGGELYLDQIEMEIDDV